jgi:hypothetical protein
MTFKTTINLSFVKNFKQCTQDQEETEKML